MDNPLLTDKIARIVYRIPKSPPRVRTKPMEVLCVGFPRTGTESLQTALLKLGYDYTYHGWDILFEEPQQLLGWSRLCRKKWYGEPNGDVSISAAEFDELIGHCVAVTDTVGSCFAAELIAAYPDAKVVLNVRRDEDAWHRSAVKTILDQVEEAWIPWFLKWFSAQGFWRLHLFYNLLLRRLFRCPGSNLASGLVPNGKWIMREHNNMIRGLVPQNRLLEWGVEDGWEPLCEVCFPRQMKEHPLTKTSSFWTRRCRTRSSRIPTTQRHSKGGLMLSEKQF